MSPRLRKALGIAGYVGFYLFALVVFAYLTFPYERLRDRVLSEFNGRQTGPDPLKLELGSLGPYWFGGVRARDIKLIAPPKPASTIAGAAGEADAAPAKPSVLAIESAHASVSLLRLLIGSVRVSFGADAFGGNVSGASFESDGARHLELELEDLNLADAPLLASAVGLPLFGTLSGDLDFELPEGKLSKANGKLAFKIKELAVGDGKAKIRDTIALPKVEAGDLNLQGEATAGQLKITNFAASGSDLELAAEGSVRLRDPTPSSQLNLTARFRFTDHYTQKSDMTKSLFGSGTTPGLFDLDAKNRRAKRADGFYAWRVTGLLSQPSFVPNPGVTAPAGAAPGAVAPPVAVPE